MPMLPINAESALVDYLGDQTLKIRGASEASGTEADGGVDSPGTPAKVPAAPPPGPADLNTWEQRTYDLDLHTSTTLGFSVASVGLDLSKRVLIFESSRSKDVSEGDHVNRFGVALRVVVEVSGLDSKDSLTLPFVAANVDLGAARATSHLIVYGYKGEDLGDLMPQWTSFGVDSYSQYMTTISKIQAIIMKNTAGIDPVLISTTQMTPSLASASEAFGQVWAFEHLAHGDRLNTALGELPATMDSTVADTVRRVYLQQLGSESELADVPAELQRKAREMVHGYALHHHWWQRD